MTNTLLPPRPPPARGAKNYSAASRRGDTSATAAAAIATSLSAAARRAILIPGDEKQVLLGKYQSSTLLKPSAPHHTAAATLRPLHCRARSNPVQLEHGTAARRGGTDRPAVSPAARGAAAALGMEPGGHTRSPIVANKCAVAPSSSIFY